MYVGHVTIFPWFLLYTLYYFDKLTQLAPTPCLSPKKYPYVFIDILLFAWFAFGIRSTNMFLNCSMLNKKLNNQL